MLELDLRSSHWGGRNWAPWFGESQFEWAQILSLCARHHLVITNTIFAIKVIYKGTWQHHRSKLWHTLDYVVIRQRDRNDENVARAMHGAEYWADHKLVRSKMSLRIRSPVKKRAPNRKLNCSALNASEVRQDLSQTH